MSGPVAAADAAPSPEEDRSAPSAVEVWDARASEVGGLTVHRSLPHRPRRTIGAWCFVDHFGPVEVTAETAMRVGPHPHIGLHTVTWLLAGEVLHTDSLGSEALIRPGQLNLMTAGRGIAHAEDATGRPLRGTSHGLQLWVAQPEATRHGEPAFEHHAELPQVELPGAVGTVLVGALGDARSPARADTPLLGVDLAVDGAVDLPLAPAWEHGVIGVSGRLRVDGTPLSVHQAAHLAPGRDELRLEAPEGARLLLLGGEPFGDRVLMWWNFVARSRDEVDAARDEWESGSDRFGTVPTALERIPAPPTPWR